MSGPPSPFDSPVPRGFNVVRATLRIAVALQCWGWAWARLGAGIDFGLTHLGVELAGLPEQLVPVGLNRIAGGLVVCGLLTLFRPCWPVLGPVALWFGLSTAAGVLAGGGPLAAASEATRTLTPLALLLLDLWPPRVRYSLGRGMLAMFLLRIGAVLAFVGYGLLALRQSQTGGPLLELVSACSLNVLRRELSPAEAQSALGVIGGVAIGLALGLLFVRSRVVAFTTTAAGLLLAMSHVFAFGPAAWPLVLLHAPDAGAPAALGLHWLLAVKEQPAVTLPAGK